MTHLRYCAEPHCSTPAVPTRLLCAEHAKRALLPTVNPAEAFADAVRRVLSRVHAESDHTWDTCWIADKLDNRGYPTPTLYNKKQRRLHHIMLESVEQKRRPDDIAHWLCGNRACVNPVHLEWAPYVPIHKRPVVRPDAKPRNPAPNKAKYPGHDDPVVADLRRRHLARQRQYRYRAAQAERLRQAELAEVL